MVLPIYAYVVYVFGIKLPICLQARGRIGVQNSLTSTFAIIITIASLLGSTTNSTKFSSMFVCFTYYKYKRLSEEMLEGKSTLFMTLMHLCC
jgi:hypothetical protein